jgi:hypothetical protein
VRASLAGAAEELALCQKSDRTRRNRRSPHVRVNLAGAAEEL